MTSFPGRYALRDLGGPVASTETRVIVARFVVLQLVERVVTGMVWPADLETECAAARPYLDAVEQLAPLDFERLSHLMAELGEGDPRKIALACIAAGQPAISRGHSFGAYGLYRMGYHISEAAQSFAVAARAASSAADLCLSLGRERASETWQRRCNAMARLCR